MHPAQRAHILCGAQLGVVATVGERHAADQDHRGSAEGAQRGDGGVAPETGKGGGGAQPAKGAEHADELSGG